MGKTYDVLDERLIEFIRAQHVFFVATAPASTDGHVNVSPKGLSTFAILGPRTVAYLDLTGSGIETVAHVRENGRITIMFCSFEGPPKILRLYGRARVHEAGDTEFDEIRGRFGDYPSPRAAIVVELDRIADSCGFGVPQYSYAGERTQLVEWAVRKGEDVYAYRAQRNAASIDGIPGLLGEDARVVDRAGRG